jgi:arabinogalactan oligomer / maltooligosaccharide transport system substrate-binding protein
MPILLSRFRIVILLALLLLAGCLPAAPSAPPVGGQLGLIVDRIVVWHSLSGQQQVALEKVINRFRALHPTAQILLRGFATDGDLVAEYKTAAYSGLGADLLLTSSMAVPELAALGYLRPIDDRATPDLLEQYLATALVTLRQQGHLYGLPQALDTYALYYNNQRVDQPPTTLDQLLAQAREGHRVVIGSGFIDALWGFRAFGANLVDPQTGSVALAPGAFVNWLTWLQQARDTQNVTLDPDRASLLEAFVSGEADYYVGTAGELPRIAESMGAHASAAPLPAGPGGSAGPFLTTNAFLFNANSTENQAALAFDVARFITNPEQQLAMMRDARHVPANLNTRISPGLYPLVAAFESQARTAVPWVGDEELVAVLTIFDDAFGRVVEGLAKPSEAVALLAEQYGDLAGAAASPAPACDAAGMLTLAAVDAGETRRALQTLVDGFAQVCPNVWIELDLASPVDAAELMRAGADRRLRSDVVYDAQSAIRQLVENDLLVDLTDRLDRDVVQSLRPAAVAALQQDDRLYGVPVNIGVEALYYNKDLVPNPASTLDDLRTQAMAGTPVTLDGGFERSFWGVGAFGGRLFDADGAFLLTPQPVEAWLTWLQAAQSQYKVGVDVNTAALRAAFDAGQIAYYLGAPEDASALRNQLGTQLGLTVLPEGPKSPGRPFLWVGSLLLNSASTTAQQDLALLFMQYAAGPEAQARLMHAVGMVPANAGISTKDEPMIATFVAQAQNAELRSDPRGQAIVAQAGDKAYAQVAAGEVSPQNAVAAMFATLARDAEWIGDGAAIATPAASAVLTPTLVPDTNP